MSHHARRGFSLMELMVVMVVIMILVGILMPVFKSVRESADRANSVNQLGSIGSACEKYQLAFNYYPGYFDDLSLADGATVNDFTANENLVVSLLGQVRRGAANSYTPAGIASPAEIPANTAIDLDRIGEGPLSNPLAANPFSPGPYYLPQPRELAPIQGTVGNQNEMPEFLDVATGLPILYFRSDPNGDKAMIVNNRVPGDGQSQAIYNRRVNADYFQSADLQNLGGETYDQRNQSLISYYGTGNNAARANSNLAWVLTTSASNDPANLRPSGFVLTAPGTDRIYFAADQNTNTVDATLIEARSMTLEFDDVVHRSGAANQ